MIVLLPRSPSLRVPRSLSYLTSRVSLSDAWSRKAEETVLRSFVHLPPISYTRILLERFDLIMGPDYHWFLRSTFQNAVKITYEQPHSVESKAQIWLCKFLAVLAIGESYLEPPPTIDLAFDKVSNNGNANETDNDSHRKPPGLELFEQALSLLHIPHEDPSTEHIEALNLLVRLKLYN